MAYEADVLIITVTTVETEAVLDAHRKLTGRAPKEITVEDRKYFDLGTINKGQVYMALSEMGSGGRGASQDSVRRAIEAFTPTSVFMVGIAFGTSEQKQTIGDVLISERLIPYELQRVGKAQLVPRGERPAASTRLRNFCKARRTSWSQSKLEFGPLLTGEKLVDDIDYRNELLLIDPETVGGEMEGAGVYVSCEEKKVDWIIIKGICDWADGNKTNPKKKANQHVAARNSVAFLFDVLLTTNMVVQQQTARTPAKEATFDWRFAGGFRQDDPLLRRLPVAFDATRTRYELCRAELETSATTLQQDGAFSRLAKDVFEKHIKSPSGSDRVDLQDAKSALLVAHELVSRYAVFGKSLRGEIKPTRADKSLKRAREIPKHFQRIYPNTVNTFVKDILQLILDRDASARLKLVPREADIANASKYIIRTTPVTSHALKTPGFAGPEVHAAYVLGRIRSDQARVDAIEVLRSFEQRISKVLGQLTSREEDKARQYYLMRRTSVLSQAMLGDREASSRYLALLLDDRLESDVNAGFHLEYYCDQPLDERLPLCSRDLGEQCTNTVAYLSSSLSKTLQRGWEVAANPLTLVEVCTLCSIVARRIHSDNSPSSLGPALQLLEQVRANLNDDDLRLYVDLCLELNAAPVGTAAKKIGTYYSAKNAPRNGWVNRGVQYPETVGAHTASTLWLCNLISEEDSARVRVGRIKDMLEVHDIAEGFTGDIVTQRKDEEHEECERRHIRKLSWLGTYLRPQVNLYPLYSSFREFQQHQTPEAIIAHEIDWIDIVLQGLAIIQCDADCDKDKIQELVNRMDKKIQSSVGRKVLALAHQMNVISENSFSATSDVAIKRYFFSRK